MTETLGLTYGTQVSSRTFVSFETAPSAAPSIKTNAAPDTPVIAVPESQTYYWTRIWQEQETESRRELCAGQGVRFANAADAIAWLTADDDD